MTEQKLIDANKLLEDMNNYNVDIEVNRLDSDEEKIRKACQAVHDHAIECINKQPVVLSPIYTTATRGSGRT